MNSYQSLQDPGKKKPPLRPTKEDLLAAAEKTVPDVIDFHLQVLFCGINPGLYTAWLGHHFGRPGNRFWPALYASGFTPRLLDPRQERELLRLGLGITNLVARATNKADELTRDELHSGKELLIPKVLHYQPRFIVILGVDSYRKAFNYASAKIGPQPFSIGTTHVWVLPNPSGLNAHFTPSVLKELFRELRFAVLSDRQ